MRWHSSTDATNCIEVRRKCHPLSLVSHSRIATLCSGTANSVEFQQPANTMYDSVPTAVGIFYYIYPEASTQRVSRWSSDSVPNPDSHANAVV